MFRIESYITPIILSHIDKYVKDFRPQDAQVSLWGGEVVFQNLDVRLDVLEEELQLPFNFVSGHIHELTVKVPWTKIASEPIQITINTIEFVLKLKSDSNVPTPKRKKSTKNDIDQAPSGYMASLVNKIANNISLKLHNIILKYVEEDIVVSMNIQLLSFDSADDNWNPAFIDISPTKVFLKKVISITDLTICLDKRNAMGKIDVCQEPILYRCSLQIRMLRKYNISSLHKSSLTRIDVFTENIELNISAQQYPMFIRLLVLAMTLKEGTSNVRSTDSITEDEYDEENDESMLLWAWNMLPSIFPVEMEDEQDDQKGHYLHAGLYVTNFSVTIKSQEFTTDNIVHSTKKIKYHPILRISISGIYADVVTLGNRWFSMKGGISFIGMYPLGMCTCGKKHNISTILTSADVPVGHKLFLNDSLQDPNCPENKGENRSYDFSWDGYYAQSLEDTSMSKTPALSFDVVHYVDIPDDMSRSSILGSDLEYSNLSESFCVRCVVGPFNFKYCSSLIHIMEALKEYLDSYDYVPYGEEKCPITLNQLSPPSTEDYDALMSDIPMKVFHLKIIHPVVELISEREESKIKIKNDKYLMPLLTIECQEISAKYIQPYYPKRLVHTTCQLPSPAEKLLDHSYNKFSSEVKKVSVNVVCGLAKHNVFHISNADITINQLIKPEFWQKIILPRIQSTANIDKIILKFNKPQMILLRYLVNSLSTGYLSSSLFESSILIDMHRKDLATLDLYLGRIYSSITTFEYTVGVTGSLQSVYGYTYTIKSMESMPEDQRFMAKSMILCTGNDNIDVIKFNLQLPIDMKSLSHPPMVKLNFHVIDFNLDPVLFEFFDYQAEYLQRQHETKAPKSPKRSFTSDKHPPASRKSVNRPESVHSSSEPTATVTLVYKPKSTKQSQSNSIDILSLVNIARCLILQIELKEVSLIVPDKSLKLLTPNSSLSSLLKKNPLLNHIAFKLPAIIIKSSHVRNNTVEFEQKFPINIPDTVWNQEKDGFPWICSFSDLTCYTIQSNNKFELLSPLKSTISIALTRKRKDEREAVYDHSFAIHIDTDPMQFNFYDEQIIFLVSSIEAITKLLSTTFCLDEQTDVPVLEICERSNNTNYHSDLKEFFGTAKTKSENSSDDTIQVEEEKHHSKLTTWIQWTLAKISLHFHSRKLDELHKFSIELEDLITSIDKQDIYMKIKTKVGFLTGNCQTKSRLKDEWERNDLLGLTTISEGLRDNLDTFIEMTFTKAMISNVHAKWQTKKKENLNLNDSITEINVTMQRIDVKLDLEMLSSFMPIFAHLTSTKPAESMPTSVISVTDLPLVYFKSKGIRIFVPIKAPDQSNVLILKIDSISVNPTVENPLIRKPVRCDIYSKAAQLRILNMPGSKVEDRQYEIVFNMISVGSGKWEEILRLMNPNESDSMYNENPAFDWNHKTEKPSIEVNAIFSNFNLAVQYAPCIVFKNVLVCGESIEVNCLSDLIMDLTTHELLMFHNLFNDMINLQESTPKPRESSFPPNTVTHPTIPKMHSKKIAARTQYKTFLKNEQPMSGAKYVDHHLTDSGFESFERFSVVKYKKIKSRTSVIKNESKFVPFDVSFVGGKFNLNVFELKINEKAEAPTIELHRQPLFSVTLFQPNMLIAQSSLDKTIQLSLFDLSFKLGSGDFESEEKFNVTVFDTHKGNLNVLGIPPSLIMYKEYTTPSGDKNLDIHIDRPMRLNLSPKILDQLLSVYSNLQTYIGQAEPQPYTLTSSSNKIQMIKSHLRDANRFNFSIAEMDFDCSIPNEFSLKLYFSKMALKLNIFDYPKRLTLDGYINSLVMSMDRFVIVNPLTINTIFVLTQEQWKKTPLLICKVSSPCVDVNIAPHNIVQALKVRDAFMACIENYLAKTQMMLTSAMNARPVIDYSNLIPIRTPRYTSPSTLSSEEHYQDDLRAGAFQFIDSNLDDALPLPYQIQIISKSGGIICWRYPQPRALHYIQLFPIPIYNPTNDSIKCRLEYYSEPHAAFMHYCEFTLSEKDVQELKLPNLKVSSEIWRILVFQPFISIDGQYFQEETSSDDEENDENHSVLEKSLKVIGETLSSHDINDYLNNESQSNLINFNPRALVGCMRIDSIFSPHLVPNVQLVTDISHISLTMKNNLKLMDKQMANVLGQYTAVGDINDVHTVIKLNSSQLNSHFCLYYDNKITLQTSFVFSTNIVDYSYLIMQPLIEELSIKFYYENADDIKVHVVADELQLRYGISVGHSLAVTEQIWRQMLTNEIPRNIFVMRYIICNCTSGPLHFGQYLTEESIYLKPNECCLYAFRSDKLEQKLAFSFGENKWCPSDPLCVGKEEVQYLKIDEDKTLIPKIEKISASQKRIIIKGQIELLNMSEKSFVVQYKNMKNKEESIEFSLNGKTSTSIVQRSNPEKDYCLNLRLHDKHGKGWSGDIPLHKTSKNIPWLVKVPTTNQHHYSFWVRVQCEPIPNQDIKNIKNQRIFITIWPLFVCRSLMISNATLLDKSSTINYDLAGCGQSLELPMAGAYDTEHELLFDSKFPFTLSYKTIDRNSFFVIPDKLESISATCADLEKTTDVNWPCSREEELRWLRKLSGQEQTSPIFKCSPSRKLSCSLLLDLLPGCLFINSIGCDINLINSVNEETCLIESNNIAVPFTLLNSFSIAFQFKNHVMATCHINLGGSNSRKVASGTSYDLPEIGSVVLQLITENGICKFVLTSLNENGIRTIILSPLFVVCNFSTEKFSFWAFCVSTKDKHNVSVDNRNAISREVPCNAKAGNLKGIGILDFTNLSHRRKDLNANHSFNYFLAIQCGKLEFSMPFLLNKIVSRISFCINNGTKFVPLSLCITEHQGQHFICIHDDAAPTIEFENRTELNLLMAQCDPNDTNRVPVEHIKDIHFEWLQNVPSHSTVFYTPPTVNENFPEMVENDIAIILACINASTPNTKWSAPIRIYKSAEFFLDLPSHGDVKIITNCRRKIAKIIIENINYKMEFNVKDIRTKILHPSEQLSNSRNPDKLDEPIADDFTDISPPDPTEALVSTQPIVQQTSIKVDLYVKGFSITLYTDNEDNNCVKTELIALYLDEITFFYIEKDRTMELGIRNFQIDNRLFSSGKFDFPVVLSAQNPQNLPTTTPNLFNIDELKSNISSTSVCYLKIMFFCDEYSPEQIFCKFQPIRAYVEDKYINVLLDFLVESHPSNLIYKQESAVHREYCETGQVLVPKVVVLQSIALADPLRIRQVRIEPLSVLLSVHTCMRMYIALDHSPLDFAPFERNEIFTLPVRFGYNLGMHYVSGAIFGAGWVVGSLEILGSPGGLARSVSTGLRDFVSMPVQGLLRGPWGFFVGITHGSASLLRNITAGTVNSVTKLAASVARNLDRLSLDDEHLQRTEALRRSRPQGITHGFAQGLTGLGISLLGAVGGIARHTLEATSSVGVMAGIGKGLVGAVTKPISGAAELVALTGQGMLHTVGFNQMPIARAVEMKKLDADEPSSEKIIGKLLPRLINTDQVLFLSFAALETVYGLKSVYVALTTSLVVLISLEKDEVIEIISIDRAYPLIDDNDSTLINLNVTSENLDESTELKGFQYGRVLQYIQDSTEDFVAMASTELPKINFGTPKADHKISFFMDQHLAQHLVNYIRLLQNCKRKN